MKKILEKARLKYSDLLASGAVGVGTAMITIWPSATAISGTALTSAATSITDEVTAALPIAAGVMAMIIGVKVAVRFFKSLAK